MAVITLYHCLPTSVAKVRNPRYSYYFTIATQVPTKPYKPAPKSMSLKPVSVIV